MRYVSKDIILSIVVYIKFIVESKSIIKKFKKDHTTLQNSNCKTTAVNYSATKLPLVLDSAFLPQRN